MVCEKCKTEMTKADITHCKYNNFFTIEIKHEWKDTKRSEIDSYLCLNCGNITLKAANLEKLR